MLNDTGKENSVPTEKGEKLGLYTEKAGAYPNEYCRVFYNENAQRFIIDNFRRILTESEEIRERNRREKKKDAPPRSARQSGGNAIGSGGTDRPGPGSTSGTGIQAKTPPGPTSHVFETTAPAPLEDLPQEYYDMLRDGWERADEAAPW